VEEPKKKKGIPTWVIVLIVVVVAGPFVIGVFSAVAIFGLRKYMVNAKQAEAKAALVTWSKGLAACGEKDGALPPSTRAVPAELSSVQAKKYQSAADEWAEPGFACAGFSMPGPQYFQYQWQQTSANEGVANALADLDGDGTPEQSLQARVSCAAGRCTSQVSFGATP
jgi:hypothetical protein